MCDQSRYWRFSSLAHHDGDVALRWREKGVVYAAWSSVPVDDNQYRIIGYVRFTSGRRYSTLKRGYCHYLNWEPVKWAVLIQGVEREIHPDPNCCKYGDAALPLWVQKVNREIAILSSVEDFIFTKETLLIGKHSQKRKRGALITCPQRSKKSKVEEEEKKEIVLSEA